MPRVLSASAMTPKLKPNCPPAGSVYVGRNTINGWRASKWANKFVVGKHGTRAECIALYAKWLCDDPERVAQCQTELHGMNLLCWCAPEPCHADVLLDLANAWEAVE